MYIKYFRYQLKTLSRFETLRGLFACISLILLLGQFSAAAQTSQIPKLIEKQGQYALSNPQGQAISAYYDAIFDFEYGHAIVQRETRFGIINQQGKELYPLKYGAKEIKVKHSQSLEKKLGNSVNGFLYLATKAKHDTALFLSYINQAYRADSNNVNHVMKIAEHVKPIDQEKAIFYYDKVYKLDDSNVMVCLQLGRATHSLSSLNAQPYFFRAYELDSLFHQQIPKDERVSYAIKFKELANQLYKKKKYKDALLMYRVSTQTDSSKVKVWRSLSYTYGLNKMHKQAIATAELVVRMDSTDYLSWRILGDALRSAEKDDDAIGAYKQGIKLSPRMALNSYNSIAIIYYFKKEYKKSAEWFEKRLEIKDDKLIKANLTYVYIRTQEYGKVVKTCSELIADNPKSYISFANRGYAYIKLNELQKAKADLEQCDKLNDYSVTPFFWACYHAHKGNKEKAMEQLEKAVKGNFKDLDWIEEETELQPIRKDPRYKALVAKLKAAQPK